MFLRYKGFLNNTEMLIIKEMFDKFNYIYIWNSCVSKNIIIAWGWGTGFSEVEDNHIHGF